MRSWKKIDTIAEPSALVGLSKPFNAGIDSLIDKATANIPDAQRGFRAIFSARQTPGASFKLE
jgi:hypothetical protein